MRILPGTSGLFFGGRGRSRGTVGARLRRRAHTLQRKLVGRKNRELRIELISDGHKNDFPQVTILLMGILQMGQLRTQIRKELRQLHRGGIGTGLHPQLQGGQIRIDLGIKLRTRGVTRLLQRIRIPQSDSGGAGLAALRWLLLGFGYEITAPPKPGADSKTHHADVATESRAVGLEGVTFHSMQHAWASGQGQAKTPLRILQELGGWAP